MVRCGLEELAKMLKKANSTLTSLILPSTSNQPTLGHCSNLPTYLLIKLACNHPLAAEVEKLLAKNKSKKDTKDVDEGSEEEDKEDDKEEEDEEDEDFNDKDMGDEDSDDSDEGDEGDEGED